MSDYKWKTKQGYEVIEKYVDPTYGDLNLIIAIIERKPQGSGRRNADYVVAWHYNEKDGSWAQGHYDFSSLKSAREYVKQTYPEAEMIAKHNKKAGTPKVHAGTWSYPYNNLQVAKQLVDALKDSKISLKDLKDRAYDAIGSDDLFDDIDDMEAEYPEDKQVEEMRKIIVRHLRDSLREVEEHPERFVRGVDERAVEYIKNELSDEKFPYNSKKNSKKNADVRQYDGKDRDKIDAYINGKRYYVKPVNDGYIFETQDGNSWIASRPNEVIEHILKTDMGYEGSWTWDYMELYFWATWQDDKYQVAQKVVDKYELNDKDLPFSETDAQKYYASGKATVPYPEYWAQSQGDEPTAAIQRKCAETLGANEQKTFSQWFDEDFQEYGKFEDYIKKFPSANTLRNATAKDIMDAAKKGFYPVYPVDSDDRELAFSFASEMLDIDYDDLYYAWLNSDL